MIPEPLVTIRVYDSADLAEADHELLVASGVAAYLSGASYRHSARTELRVPESQMATAIELLPHEVPTLEDLQEPDRTCARCGSAQIEHSRLGANFALGFGALVAVIALLLGRPEAAGVWALLAVAAVVMLRGRARPRCRNCGEVWQPAD